MVNNTHSWNDISLIKISELKSPPRVGKVYIVPCVKRISDNLKIPILIPGHYAEDRYNSFHYHIDTRFAKRQVKAAFVDMYYLSVGANDCFYPIDTPMICIRKQKYPNLSPKLVNIFTSLQDDINQFQNGLCKKYQKAHLDLSCKKCPHQGTDLDSIPIIDGKIKCPSHGLTFDAQTGKVLS